MAALQRLVAYERVSTVRQGASGLGLEAQRKVIEDFTVSRGAEVLARFTESESGRKGGPAGTGQGLAPREGHRRDTRNRQAGPALRAMQRSCSPCGTVGFGSWPVDLPEAR